MVAAYYKQAPAIDMPLGHNYYCEPGLSVHVLHSKKCLVKLINRNLVTLVAKMKLTKKIYFYTNLVKVIFYFLCYVYSYLVLNV